MSLQHPLRLQCMVLLPAEMHSRSMLPVTALAVRLMRPLGPGLLPLPSPASSRPPPAPPALAAVQKHSQELSVVAKLVAAVCHRHQVEANCGDTMRHRCRPESEPCSRTTLTGETVGTNSNNSLILTCTHCARSPQTLAQQLALELAVACIFCV